MKAYKIVSGVVQVGAGVQIGLGRSQAEARAHKLKPVEGSTGVYIATAVLDFRAGEIVGLEGTADIGKAQLDQIAEATPEEVRAAIEAARKADAAQQAAKDAARARIKPVPEAKAGVSREDLRKAERRGDEAGYKRGFEEGKAAGIAEARAERESEWASLYENSADLKAEFATLEAYVEARRKAG
ncbi:hypothetical protein [Reyranella sp.]|uniref:hypothetical protein n=1 Tax=Reyranella sp. TaxID=1929291 RepID=UPI003C7C8EF4